MQTPAYGVPYQYPNLNFFTPPAGAGPPGLPYFPPVARAPPPPPSSPPPPVQPKDRRAVTPEAAAFALRRLIALQLKAAGYHGAKQDAMDLLQNEVEAFIHDVAHRAHDYANLASRTVPSAVDIYEVCQERHGLDLRSMKTTSRKRKRIAAQAPALVSPPSRSPSPDQLHSDEEGVPMHVPVTLRFVPPHFPKLPPKHTYLRTPPTPAKYRFPPSSTLERKLANASLVQESLKNLIEATEDKEGAGRDGDILGGVVNWEAHHIHSGHKKWKVG